jgi:hypothetical protein
VSPSSEPGPSRSDGTQGAGATPAGDIGPLEALVIAGLPPSDAGVRDDGDGYVAVPEAVGDLAVFTGAVDGTASDMMADLFIQAGFVEEYYRRWLISESDRPSMLGIQLFRFRDPGAAAEQEDVRGLTYELVAFDRGPVLAAITFVFPPELPNASGRARAGEIATLQGDRMVDQLRSADG